MLIILSCVEINSPKNNVQRKAEEDKYGYSGSFMNNANYKKSFQKKYTSEKQGRLSKVGLGSYSDFWSDLQAQQ